MLRLPTCIKARIVDISGGSIPAADILVGINLLVSDRYYYGNLLGLTDAAGVAIITRDELDLRFAADRAMYPMDYKLNTDCCDPMIEIFILSEVQIAAAKDAIAASSVSYDVDDAYRRARNSDYSPTLARVWADLPGERELVISLTAGRNSRA
jgi:hypothetical protein